MTTYEERMQELHIANKKDLILVSNQADQLRKQLESTVPIIQAVDDLLKEWRDRSNGYSGLISRIYALERAVKGEQP
jgi:hypothetical protein